MKLNCDLGEDKPAIDAAIMPFIDQANIACGGHASNATGMRTAVKLAIKHNVSIGAHPSYEDKSNFGRVDMDLNSAAIEQLIHQQVNLLVDICDSEGTSVDYLKPHGALYNRMMRDETVFIAILTAIQHLKQPIPLMILSKTQSSLYEDIAFNKGISLIKEVFSDREYQDNGDLVPRNQPGALLDTCNIEQRIKDLSKHQIQTVSGKFLPIHADSICVHGDDPHALASVKKIRKMITANQYE